MNREQVREAMITTCDFIPDEWLNKLTNAIMALDETSGPSGEALSSSKPVTVTRKELLAVVSHDCPDVNKVMRLEEYLTAQGVNVEVNE